MIKVITFQLILLTLIGTLWILEQMKGLPGFWFENQLAIHCIMFGSLGGCLYCLRAVYINKCVKGKWSPEWELWYFLRPITSSISGLVAYLFLKAGLIILDAEQTDNQVDYGYLAFAFIAGLNVDNFITKLEDIAKSVFGIEKSRAAIDSENNK